jgi:hypothetical protein
MTPIIFTNLDIFRANLRHKTRIYKVAQKDAFQYAVCSYQSGFCCQQRSEPRKCESIETETADFPLFAHIKNRGYLKLNTEIVKTA